MIAPQEAAAEAAEAAGSVRPGAVSRLDDDDLRTLLLIRHFEQALLELFGRGELNGTTHTCIGQEYVPVAVSALLAAGDFVFSNHRGHGHYLARFGDPHGLLAEIMGRAGAVCGGVGGSQHIHRDRYLSTGVQGQSLPVAVGTALHLRDAEPGVIACVYVGDGTWGEGAVYEALNMAALWQVPLLVVVENNGIAQTTPAAAHLAGTVAARARAFGLPYHRTESTDVTEIRAGLAPLIRQVRGTGGPAVAEFVTCRLAAHSKGDDTRPPDELRRIESLDWCRRYAAGQPGHFRQWDDWARAHVAEVVRDVAGRPLAEGAGA